MKRVDKHVHSQASRKKMSEKVLLAYKEGRLTGFTKEATAKGIAAAAEVHRDVAAHTNQSLAIIDFITENWFTKYPDFDNDDDATSMIWVALANLDIPKILQNLDDKEESKALGSILWRFNQYLPEDLQMSGISYTINMCDSTKAVVREFASFLVEKYYILEDYLASKYIKAGQFKAQNLNVLERRFKKNWSKDNKQLEVKTNTDNESNSTSITINFTDAT